MRRASFPSLPSLAREIAREIVGAERLPYYSCVCFVSSRLASKEARKRAKRLNLLDLKNRIEVEVGAIRYGDGGHRGRYLI